ncbi:alpha-amylase [Oceanobacillus limi]|uniref:Alpha-amylase n=1 Tax=Oceanobacillus limi TaxID=930131 RepID=A0A1I0C4M8_9BACI|nr:alpha-amylase family glycosyl hydrolase [Oceanobacillus limi]SET14398.1 alpha-amylase [Oceanobacillus limi]
MKKIMLLLTAILSIYIQSSEQVSAEETDINGEIIYEIFVDRFNNGNHALTEQVDLEDPYAYHGGDLEGITRKLDDLKQLGFTTISLSPIFANAPDGYHGYWIEDFYEVEEQFGTLEDLQTLVEEAHDRDMKIVLEFVPNYVAKTSPLVSDPEKSDWFYDNEPIPTGANTWEDNVVRLNQEHPEVEALLMDVADYWIEEANIDGLKLHAADQSSPAFLDTFTTHIKTNNPDFYIIADLLTDNDAKHVFTNPNIDIVENKPLYEAMTNVFSTVDNPTSELYEVWENETPKNGFVYVDNAFTDRFTQLFSVNGRNSLTVWQLALTYMLTSPGVPAVYQGSEIPMLGEFPDSQRLVDFNSGEPDLKEFMERITSLRQEFPVMKYGDYQLVATDQGMSVFKRTYQDETMYIAINNDSESRAVSIEMDSGYQLRGLLGDNIAREQDNGKYKVGIPRESAEVYVIENDTGLNWGFISPMIVVFLLFVFGIFYLTRKQKKNNQTGKY